MITNVSPMQPDLICKFDGKFNVASLHATDSKIYFLDNSKENPGLCALSLNGEPSITRLVERNITSMAVHAEEIFVGTEDGEVGKVIKDDQINFLAITTCSINLLKVWESLFYFTDIGERHALKIHENGSTRTVWQLKRDNNITCFDVSEDFIFLALQVSDIFLFDRITQKQITTIYPDVRTGFSPIVDLKYSEGTLGFKTDCGRVSMSKITAVEGKGIKCKTNVVSVSTNTVLNTYKTWLIIGSSDWERGLIQFVDDETRTFTINISNDISFVHYSKGKLFVCERDGKISLFKYELQEKQSIPQKNKVKDGCQIC